MRMVALCADVEEAELEQVAVVEEVVRRVAMVEDAVRRVAVVDVELSKLPKTR